MSTLLSTSNNLRAESVLITVGIVPPMLLKNKSRSSIAMSTEISFGRTPWRLLLSARVASVRCRGQRTFETKPTSKLTLYQRSHQRIAAASNIGPLTLWLSRQPVALVSPLWTDRGVVECSQCVPLLDCGVGTWRHL